MRPIHGRNILLTRMTFTNFFDSDGWSLIFWTSPCRYSERREEAWTCLWSYGISLKSCHINAATIIGSLTCKKKKKKKKKGDVSSLLFRFFLSLFYSYLLFSFFFFRPRYKARKAFSMQYRYRRLCTHSLPGGARLDLLQRHFHGFLILRASRWIPYLPHTTPVYPKIRESNSYYVYTALSRDIPRETYSYSRTFRTKDSSIPHIFPSTYSYQIPILLIENIKWIIQFYSVTIIPTTSLLKIQDLWNIYTRVYPWKTVRSFFKLIQQTKQT